MKTRDHFWQQMSDSDGHKTDTQSSVITWPARLSAELSLYPPTS
ncbi:hypothetical protein [Klebsiella pneumoniae]|nr:hypothetical protein [Klebsiella pneumoniae]MDV5501093.1 hypothetical protein [Klebsiella pneumoniae]